MRVIAIANPKGGSAKTTTAIHLATGLAGRGRAVLLIDADPQGHVAEMLGFPTRGLDHDISRVLEGVLALTNVLIEARPGVHIAPANVRLAQTEAALCGEPHREDRLRRMLDAVQGYGFCLIDCPPGLGWLTRNALAAADEALIPMATEFLALLGVIQLLDIIDEIRFEINPNLALLGLLPTRYTRTINARAVVEQAREDLAGRLRVYETPIPETIRLKEAAALGRTIYEHDPANPAALAYLKLAQDINDEPTRT